MPQGLEVRVLSRALKLYKMIIINESNQVVKAVKIALPSVVSILVSKHFSEIKEELRNDLVDKCSIIDEKGMVNISGCSGFFITSDGYVITNYHVVSEENVSYEIIWQNKKYPCEILCKDKINDVAIIKTEIKNTPFLQMGDSSKLNLGQTVIAIGNALGEFQNSVSRGIVSGLSRYLKTNESENYSDAQEFTGLIQTDAAINPGNSGGPLINLNGQVIGVNTAVVLGVENIGFAVPINKVKKVLNEVKKYGKICRPSLGVRYILIDKTIQKNHNLPFDYGAYITHETISSQSGVISKSPAEKAGLKSGNIILSCDNIDISVKNPLKNILEKYQAGDAVKLKIWSENTTKEVIINLEC